MRFIVSPVTALIAALLLGVASAFGFATNPAFGYVLLGLAVAVLLIAVLEWGRGKRWRLQWPLTTTPREQVLDQRRADFQRDALEKLQQALHEMDVAASYAAPSRRRLRYEGPDDPDPTVALDEAAHRVNTYRVRLDDGTLVEAVQRFYGAAMEEATGFSQNDLLTVIETKQANLNRANERIGVMLRSLH